MDIAIDSVHRSEYVSLAGSVFSKYFKMVS